MSTYMAYEAQKKELEDQIGEVERLKCNTQNQGVKDLLSDEVDKVRSQIMKLEPPKYKKTSETYDVKWFETNDFMEITLLYESVDPKKIETDIKSSSLDIKLHEVDGTNYRYTIPKLNKEIIPSESKVEVDSKYVLIKLAKFSKEKFWSALQGRKDPSRTKATKGMRKSSSPLPKDFFEFEKTM